VRCAWADAHSPTWTTPGGDLRLSRTTPTWTTAFFSCTAWVLRRRSQCVRERSLLALQPSRRAQTRQVRASQHARGAWVLFTGEAGRAGGAGDVAPAQALGKLLGLGPRFADEVHLSEARAARAALRTDEVRLNAGAEAVRGAMRHRAHLARETLSVEDVRARDRAVAADAGERTRRGDQLRLREASGRAQEALRRRTDEILLARRLADEAQVEALRREAELARIRAEAEARGAAERENEDIRLRAMRARAAEDRRRVLEAVALASAYVARGAAALLDDPWLLATLVGAIVVLVGGGFFAREAAILARSLAEAYLGRPRLVRETSRKRFGHARRAALLVVRAGHAFAFVAAAAVVRAACCTAATARCSCRTTSKRECRRRTAVDRDAAAARAAAMRAAAARTAKAATEDSWLDGVVLPEELRARVARLAAAARAERCPTRMPGARRSEGRSEGREHTRVCMGGGRSFTGWDAPAGRDTQRQTKSCPLPSHAPPWAARHREDARGQAPRDRVGPRVRAHVRRRRRSARRVPAFPDPLRRREGAGPCAGPDGVTALHALFRWARTSGTGVLVFVDEAEAFLASRSRARLTEYMRNALNAFLYQTGSPTTSFVLVLATNRLPSASDS